MALDQQCSLNGAAAASKATTKVTIQKLLYKSYYTKATIQKLLYKSYYKSHYNDMVSSMP